MNITLIDSIVWFAYFISLFFLVYWLLYFLEKREEMKREHDKPKPILKNFPMVSIAVPAYNDGWHVVKTLNSLIKLDYPQDKFEILVINDGSKDDTERIVKNYIKKQKTNSAINKISITLINQPKNQGKAEALNKALEFSKGELFACIDADSTVESDALVYMVDMFQRDKKLAIVTPVMKIHEPKNWIQKFQRLEYISSMMVSKLMGYMDCIYVAPGPFSIYRVAVLKKLGKFDGKHNIEDQEIAWRAQKNHYKIRQCSKAFVHTVGPKTVKQFTRQRTRWYRGSMMTMFQYKDMALNKKYGDFGIFQYPLMILAYSLSLVALFAFIYYILKPIFKQIQYWFLINFDFITELKNMKFNFNILDIEITQVLVIYIALFITVILLYFASRMSNEKIRKYGSIYIIPYFFVYYVILSLILIKTFFEIIFRIKQKW